MEQSWQGVCQQQYLRWIDSCSRATAQRLLKGTEYTQLVHREVSKPQMTFTLVNTVSMYHVCTGWVFVKVLYHGYIHF